jgi:Ni,Fe-hydrogenase III small subunit
MSLAVNILTKSLNVFHLAGSPCNNCDIELLDTLTPRYDLERFGIVLVGSIRHADVVFLTGAFNKKSTLRAKAVYEQAPKPVVVVALGNCACTANIFRDSYNVDPPISRHIPVDIYVPGCPPKPEAMIAAAVKLIAKLKGSK